MITQKQALDLLHKYGLSEKRIAHSMGVSLFAFELASKIKTNHPDLPVDPEKVTLAALLHDIGRSQPGDHELNTLAILKSEGLKDLADITIHGSIYEIMLLRGTDDPSLKPRSLENKIVAYSDSRFRDHVVSMQQRWAEIEQRRSGEKEKMESLQMAKSRFFEMEKELLELSEG
jgi:putative nucleotidyltransferase with HDIG domain